MRVKYMHTLFYMIFSKQVVQIKCIEIRKRFRKA